MSGVRITVTADIPVIADGAEADAEEIAVHLISTTGTGQEPVYTRIEEYRPADWFMRVTFSAEPDKIALMMMRLTALWARWDHADGRLLPQVP